MRACLESQVQQLSVHAMLLGQAHPMVVPLGLAKVMHRFCHLQQQAKACWLTLTVLHIKSARPKTEVIRSKAFCPIYCMQKTATQSNASMVCTIVMLTVSCHSQTVLSRFVIPCHCSLFMVTVCCSSTVHYSPSLFHTVVLPHSGVATAF